MNPTAIFASATSSAPSHSVLADLPQWVEAGLVGLIIGGTIGLWLAMLYRHRARRAFARMQRELVTNAFYSDRPELKVFPIVASDGGASKTGSLDEHVDALKSALGPEATAEWGAELERQRAKLVRLHRALE